MEGKSESLTKSCTKYSKSSFVEISVSGSKFEIPVENILKHPGTLLENMLPELTKEKREEISFNRPVDSFKAIRSFYLTGKLHMPLNLCPEEFAEEMEYWGIQTEILEPCCLYRYLSFKQQEEISREFRKTIPPTLHPNINPGSSWRQRLWLIIDNRESSLQAKLYLGFIVLFVLLSLASLSLSTLPTFQRKLTICETRDLLFYYHDYEDDVENYFAHMECDRTAEDVLRTFLGDYGAYTDEMFREKIKEMKASGMDIEDTKQIEFKWKLKKIKLPNKSARLKVFDLIDIIVLAVFTVDLILRLVTCPSLASYYKSALNVIDTGVLICGILGYALENLLIKFTFDRGDLDILVYLQQLRVFRLIRIVQNVAAIKVLAFCFKTNFKEILILMLFLFVGVNIFANMLFFVEQNISSIPEAWWWGIITMTTVGYGDLYPVTASGRIIGTLCAVSGVIVLALIIPIFVNNFLALYELACLLQKEKDKKSKTKTLQIKVEPLKF